ncbi:MAG: zinc finger MYND domain-containing protein, partial [Terriglobus roseus]|nr:zinc finger MYND domain-containing protein [Terriglobus roseus]
RSRRQIPPPIEIPPAFSQSSPANPDPAPLPSFSLSSPPERTTFGRTHHHHHHHHRSHESRTPGFATGNGRHMITQPLVTAGPLLDDASQESFAIRPVREVDRLPSMLPSLQAEITSQPESPTTPNAPAQLRPSSPREPRNRRRPSIRHQQSMSGDSDDNPADEIADGPSDSVPPPPPGEPMVGLQQDIQMQDVDTEDAIEAGATPVRLAPPVAEGADAETFNITHPTLLDGSIVNPTTPQATTPFSIPQIPTLNILNAMNTTPPTMNMPLLPWGGPRALANSITDRAIAACIVAAVPRDEDVLMSLQLLAYVSKYCNLRRYFQNSHLVPGLKIGKQLALLDGEMPPADEPLAFEDDPDNEYLLPEDLNIFPLVEQFTVRHHTQDMQYWAGVVMRNLCRKDDSRGGIRQCAYYQCGRWEEYTRQFAKCRRCRRTKYCSKDCQKSAWVFHRHWCVAAQQ